MIRAEPRLIEERLSRHDQVIGHFFLDRYAVELRSFEHRFDFCSQAVALQGPIRDEIFEVVVNDVTGGSAGDSVGRDSQSVFRKLSERRVNFLVDLPKLQQRVRVGAQAAWQNFGVPQVDVIGKEIVRAGYAEILYSRTGDRDEGARDLRLDVAVIPGEARAHDWSGAARRLKEEIGIAEEREGWLAVGIGDGVHVQQLHRRRIDNRTLKVGTQTGAEQALAQSGVRIHRAEASHSLFQSTDRAAGGKRLSIHIGGSGVVKMDRIRRRVASSLSEAEQIDVQLTDAVRSVGARNIRHNVAIVLDFGAVAVRRAGRAANEMVTLVWCKDEQRVAFVDTGFFQVQEKRAERGIVIRQLIHVRSLAGAEGAFGGRGFLMIVMRVGDVSVDDGNAFLQHRLDYRERLRGDWVEIQLVKPCKRNTVVIGDAAGGAAGKRGVDVLQVEQGLIAGVAARFVRQSVTHSHHAEGWIRLAERIAERAMD